MTHVARVFGRAGLALALLTLIGCASPSDITTAEAMYGGKNESHHDTEIPLKRDGCTVSANLLADVEFEGLDDGTWSYIQHAGERSFAVTSMLGELRLTRIGTQPWMLLLQEVALPEGSSKTDRTLVMSADLKGMIETEPALHAFEHSAGLFLQPASSPMSAKSAEHTPNQGVWDWQKVVVESPLSKGRTTIKAGFTHKAGGSLWARNPSLVLMECAKPS